MAVIFRVTSVSLFLALAACSVGEVPSGNTPPADAPAPTTDGPPSTIDAPPANDPAATYEAQVRPIVTKDIAGKTCASADCHGGTTVPNMTSYDTLAARFKVKPGADNRLVNRGAHAGPALPAADAAIIAAWIDSLPAQ
ncbi:MAG: hypothetical protein H7138_05220 [Myxococcales bacterium]|nr:hypothetical protein [Myxococcales bacterium]